MRSILVIIFILSVLTAVMSRKRRVRKSSTAQTYCCNHNDSSKGWGEEPDTALGKKIGPCESKARPASKDWNSYDIGCCKSISDTDICNSALDKKSKKSRRRNRMRRSA